LPCTQHPNRRQISQKRNKTQCQLRDFECRIPAASRTPKCKRTASNSNRKTREFEKLPRFTFSPEGCETERWLVSRGSPRLPAYSLPPSGLNCRRASIQIQSKWVQMRSLDQLGRAFENPKLNRPHEIWRRGNLFGAEPIVDGPLGDLFMSRVDPGLAISMFVMRFAWSITNSRQKDWTWHIRDIVVPIKD